jgi:antitoxin component of MazEF toxin-antitoxin module
MKLQKQVSRKVKDKEYGKYVVVIPPEEIEELDWPEGQELKSEVKGKKLIISRKDEN